jgi:Transposase DDE domain
MDAFSDVPVDVEQDLDFDQAFQSLLKLVDIRHADELQPLGPGAVYIASTVLWLLVYQRLAPRSTLQTTVKYFQEIAPQLCPDNRRIREQTLSNSTAGYSDGRQWLTEETAEWFAKTVSQSICETTRPTLGTRRVFLVDGTTLTLAPEESLRALYPPATNQYGVSAWPVALIVVNHELESGCAMLPEIGAKFGPQAVSEVVLARACFQRLPPSSVVLADAGFGIFSVAWAAHDCGHSFLLRLTAQRFRALLKRSTWVAEGDGWTTYECVWKPSAQECRNNPQVPATAVLTVRLHVLKMPTGNELYLLTDLSDDALAMGAVYYKRMDVETDISNIKIVLDMEHIRARSPSMFRKELLTSMVAYNLVVQFRRQAAQLAKVPPRRLSFTNVWSTFRIVLLSRWSTDPAEWRQQYRKALHRAMRDKLPNRPGRSYPREAYRRTSKTTHFIKRNPCPKPPALIHQSAPK